VDLALLVRPITFFLALLAVIAVGCVDRGMIIVVENRTDGPFLARGSGSAFGETITPYLAVVSLPPRTSLVVARNDFAGDVVVNQVEILTAECAPVATFDSFPQNGGLIVVEEGPIIEIRDEFPTEGEDASPSDQCLVPAASP
jgi:hypothetical protein